MHGSLNECNAVRWQIGCAAGLLLLCVYMPYGCSRSAVVTVCSVGIGSYLAVLDPVIATVDKVSRSTAGSMIV